MRRRRPLTFQAKALNPDPPTYLGREGTMDENQKKNGTRGAKNGHRDETTLTGVGRDGQGTHLPPLSMAIFFRSFSYRPSVNGLTFVFFLSTPRLLYILDSTVQYLAPSPNSLVESRPITATSRGQSAPASAYCTLGAKTSLSSRPCRSRFKSTLSQSRRLPLARRHTTKATNQAKPANHCLSFAVVQSSGLLDRPGLEASIAYLV